MKVRNAFTLKAALEHKGQIKVWSLLEEGECKTVNHVEEFIVEKELEPHKSKIPAEEFYYILQGRGVMRINGEEKEVGPGDLIYIPSGALHGIRVMGTFPLHALSWKVLVK